MKYSDLSALAIKVAGLVLLVLTLSKLPEYFELLKASQNAYSPSSAWIIVLPFAVVFIASVILIIFPYKISNKLVVEQSKPEDANSEHSIQITGIRLLGLLLLFWAISDLVFHFFIYFIYRDMVEASFGAGAYDYASLLATIAEFIFATLLLYKANTISCYLNKVGK